MLLNTSHKRSLLWTFFWGALLLILCGIYFHFVGYRGSKVGKCTWIYPELPRWLLHVGWWKGCDSVRRAETAHCYCTSTSEKPFYLDTGWSNQVLSAVHSLSHSRYQRSSGFLTFQRKESKFVLQWNQDEMETCIYSKIFELCGHLDMTLHSLISDRCQHFGGTSCIWPLPSKWRQHVIPEHYYCSIKMHEAISWLTIINTTMRASSFT